MMRLRVVLPHKVFLEQEGVRRIVVETREGSFGLLPRRLDCVAPLVPGILLYETDSGGESYLAVGTGVMTKVGPDVSVAVRTAVAGADLGNLREVVARQLAKGDEQEKTVRSALARLESSFVRRFLELKRYG